jgi:chemotaxis protein methyltransferase WspC
MSAPKPSSAPPRQNIEELRRMADRGLLAEAATGCEIYLREAGASPDALHLLGLISDAANNSVAAAQYYRKALYLDPDHQEALTHLALLLKRQGDAAGAKLLNDRMRRLGERTSK